MLIEAQGKKNMLSINQPVMGLNDMNSYRVQTGISVDQNCSGIVLPVLFVGQKAMTEPGQTKCIGSAILGNGILVLDGTSHQTTHLKKIPLR